MVWKKCKYIYIMLLQNKYRCMHIYAWSVSKESIQVNELTGKECFTLSKYEHFLEYTSQTNFKHNYKVTLLSISRKLDHANYALRTSFNVVYQRDARPWGHLVPPFGKSPFHVCRRTTVFANDYLAFFKPLLRQARGGSNKRQIKSPRPTRNALGLPPPPQNLVLFIILTQEKPRGGGE